MTTFTRGLRSSASDEWRTPKYLFDELNREFNFTVDAASTDENALVDKHWTIREDGLAQSWDGERVWCNPPYGRQISQWVRKASEAVGGLSSCSYQHAQTRLTGMIMYLLMHLILGLFEVGYILVTVKTQPHFQVR